MGNSAIGLTPPSLKNDSRLLTGLGAMGEANGLGAIGKERAALLCTGDGAIGLCMGDGAIRLTPPSLTNDPGLLTGLGATGEEIGEANGDATGNSLNWVSDVLLSNHESTGAATGNTLPCSRPPRDSRQLEVAKEEKHPFETTTVLVDE